MGSGFSKMQKQAREMKKQIEKMQEEMKNSSYTGDSGNGLVSVTIDGEKVLKSIRIQPECIDPSDPEGLQDLIITAFARAYAQIEKQQEGFSLPF